MNSTKIYGASTLSLAALAAAAVAVLPAPALAVPMVVRAVGPSAAIYKPGQKLSETATMVLKSGDTLTVLDAKGTRSFTGPGSFRFDQASATAGRRPPFPNCSPRRPNAVPASGPCAVRRAK